MLRVEESFLLLQTQKSVAFVYLAGRKFCSCSSSCGENGVKYIGGIGSGSCVVGGEDPCDVPTVHAHSVRLRPKSGNQSCSVRAMMSLLVVHDRFDEEVRDACCIVDIVVVVHTMNRGSIWNNKLVNLHTRTVQPLEVQICAKNVCACRYHTT